MQSVVIHELPGWRVTSYGNGLAYEFANLSEQATLFFQGDGACDFRDLLDNLTTGKPALDYRDAFAVIWSEFGEGAEPFWSDKFMDTAEQILGVQ